MHAARPLQERADETGREFVLTSSSGPETFEVLEMKKALENGSPVLAYELLQGMVDYGRGHEPQPRVWLEYRSGHRTVFQGRIESSEDDPIVAIEFVNGGTGMVPEDTVIYRHSGNGKAKLGGYGRGLTTALTVLAEQEGSVTKVQSHVDGRVWEGTTSLTPSETGVTNLLQFQGHFLPENMASRQTVIRVEHPPQFLIDGLSRIDQHFLYANPMYPDVCLVDRDTSEEREPPQRYALHDGEVMCVKSMIDHEPGNCKFLFVDGLRIPLSGCAILPWSIHERSTDESQRSFRVRRDHTSTRCDEYNASKFLEQAIDRCEERAILEALIEKALANPDTKYLEFQNSYWYPGPKTSDLVQAIWKDRFEGALIDDDPEWVHSFEGRGSETKAKCVPPHLYHFLKAAGVPTLSGSDLAQGALRKKFSLGYLEVPSANSPHALERLMERVARYGGDVEIATLDGKKYLRIRLDGVVKDEEVLTGKTEDDIGVMVRYISVLAQTQKLDPIIFSIDGEHVYQLLMTALADARWPSRFLVKGTIDERKRSHFPNLRGCLSGSTYIYLSGALMDDVEETPRMKMLLEKFLAALREIRKRLSAPKGFRWKPSRSRPTAAVVEQHLADVQHTPAAFVRRKEDQVSATEAPDFGSMTLIVRSKEIDPEHRQILPCGYYKRHVGSEFVVDVEANRPQWVSDQRWIFQNVPVRRPKKFVSRRVLKDFCGDETITVPAGTKISGFIANADADLEFYREARTGLYSLRGKAGMVTYFTEEDEEAPYDYLSPVPVEGESFVDVSELAPFWRTFLLDVRSQPELTTRAKVDLAKKAWRNYQPEEMFDRQAPHTQREKVAAQILNGFEQEGPLAPSALALLLRSIGIPSRVCNGEYIGEQEVRPHTWVEFWNNAKWETLEIPEREEKEEKSVDRSVSAPRSSTRMRLLIALAAAGIAAGGAAYVLRSSQARGPVQQAEIDRVEPEEESSPGKVMKFIRELVCE